MKLIRNFILSLMVLSVSGCIASPRLVDRRLPIEEPEQMVAEAPKEMPAPVMQKRVVVEVNVNDYNSLAPAAGGTQEPQIIYAPSCIPAEYTPEPEKPAKKRIIKAKPKKKVVC